MRTHKLLIVVIGMFVENTQRQSDLPRFTDSRLAYRMIMMMQFSRCKVQSGRRKGQSDISSVYSMDGGWVTECERKCVRVSECMSA